LSEERPTIPASGPEGPPDPEPPPDRAEPGADAGTYIGRLPERSEATIPGGHQRKDRRVSGVATQPGPASPDAGTPEGHREAESHNDDRIREAGDRQ
jgi:hypothetical protein